MACGVLCNFLSGRLQSLNSGWAKQMLLYQKNGLREVGKNQFHSRAFFSTRAIIASTSLSVNARFEEPVPANRCRAAIYPVGPGGSWRPGDKNLRARFDSLAQLRRVSIRKIGPVVLGARNLPCNVERQPGTRKGMPISLVPASEHEIDGSSHGRHFFPTTRASRGLHGNDAPGRRTRPVGVRTWSG